MMSFLSLTELILKGADTPCLLELQAALKAGSVLPVAEPPGRHPARRAALVFGGEAGTTKAGVSCGIEQTVRALEALPEVDEVLLFGFSGSGRRFIVFVAAKSNRIVGCVRVGKAVAPP
jgi:hypothetical protein